MDTRNNEEENDGGTDIGWLIEHLRARRERSANTSSKDDASPSFPGHAPGGGATRRAVDVLAFPEIVAALGEEELADASSAGACRACREKLLLAAALAEGREVVPAPRWRLRGIPACSPNPAERDLRVKELLAAAHAVAAKNLDCNATALDPQAKSRRQMVGASIARLCADPALLRASPTSAQPAPGCHDGEPRPS